METAILGLSFSSRMRGLAVLTSNQLVDYSIKLHKEMFSLEKRDVILVSLASCIVHYTITDIVLSMPDLHHQTKEFKEILSAIETMAFVHGIPVLQYSAKELYRQFGSPVKRTRDSLMKRLSWYYPELKRYYERELQNRNKYYIKLFEAVAAASYHWLLTIGK